MRNIVVGWFGKMLSCVCVCVCVCVCGEREKDEDRETEEKQGERGGLGVARC